MLSAVSLVPLQGKPSPMALSADDGYHSSGEEQRSPSPSSTASTSASSSSSTSPAASFAVTSSSSTSYLTASDVSHHSAPPSPSPSPSLLSSSAFELDGKFSADELLRTRTVLLTGDDVSVKREELRSYFHRTFSLYEELFSLLASDDSFYQQPDPLRHPLVFYFGHTAVFFVNKLILARLLPRRIHSGIEATCAIGVDEMSWDDCNPAHYDWPSVQQLREYRDEVRVTVDRLISRMELSLPITQSSPAWVLLMGVEHERIHLETSSVLFRQLPLHHIRPSPTFPVCPTWRSTPSEVPGNSLVPVPSGRVHLGKAAADATYGWDNEYGRLDVDVEAFHAASFLCSNAEFLSFVQAGGYSEPRWWGEEGWKYRQFRQLTHPLFWVAPSGQTEGWRLRCIAEEVAMPWDWPVEVNYLEAKAFCTWKAATTGRCIRMPTEAEWTRMRDFAFPLRSEEGGAVQDQPHWSRAPGNVNLEHFVSASPVDLFPFGASALYDVVGNVWQWTESAITALPGFAPHPLYDDFSVPTFDGRHNLLMGGSFISTGNEALRSARYAFRRHFMQHAGFRYVDSDAELPPPSLQVFTEADPSISVAIHSHFAPVQPLRLPNYHVQLAQLLLQAVGAAPSVPSAASVLELGCGVGRLSFELAASGRFTRVTGVDRSARTIRLASHLQHSTGGLPYQLPLEGELLSYHEVSLAQSGLHLTPAAQQSLLFLQADVNNLDERHTAVDVLLLHSVLHQLRRPADFLASLHLRLNPNGLLVVANSGHWDEEVTAKEQWLGGKRENGEAIDSSAALHDALLTHFTPVQAETELHSAEYVDKRTAVVHSVAVSVWRRK